ncbi:MAG: SET domain-containing protein-lysine N-methyltransferase [bacterium]
MPATAHSYPCTVRDTVTGVGLFATRDIAHGECILEIHGTIQRSPTRYSIQIGADEHIECQESLPDAEMRVRFPWRFLNHCCEPNCSIAGRTLVARGAIRSGDQLTFDYTTTEAMMAEPFECKCGAPGCLRRVQGFLALAHDEQRARALLVAPHLKPFLPKPSA